MAAPVRRRNHPPSDESGESGGTGEGAARVEGAGGNACPKRLEPEALEKISNLLIEASEHCACVLIWPDATASVTFVPQAATEEVLPQNFIAAAVAELLRDEALFTAALRKAVGETLQ